MPGKRSTNLRKGDRAEGFGIQALRSFAAVAPVPREEDIGIDIICTLLRPEGALQYAEDSFFVQIKSVSVSEITYEDDDYIWLCNLLLPIFIARVDLGASKIEIFSMQRVFTRAKRSCKGVKVYLGEGDSNSDQDVDCVPLGHPILEWTSADEAKPSFHEDIYQIMKAWVMHEQKNRLLRQAHRCQELDWTTNKFPRIGTARIGADDEALRNLLEGIAPFLFPLADSLLGQFCSGDVEVVKPLKSVFELDQLIRLSGVETDPAPTIWLLAIKNLAKSMNEEERKTQLPQILKEWGFPVNE
ncbi:hypothetical protein H6F93_01710 [Leptolyngbya sp. FACHB-671]|uniref:hypothetical protein n=1 Tax=Leptolyngbya sp. FACHB-671 TaxID=2692812 RepID=UPI0016895E28|nr:hypothetical protein [Leptolyngbya sp. FACHB-671]MBD2066255.1 hypothetical protein [Leptolyngbya sp. FACHB-671]